MAPSPIHPVSERRCHMMQLSPMGKQGCNSQVPKAMLLLVTGFFCAIRGCQKGVGAGPRAG